MTDTRIDQCFEATVKLAELINNAVDTAQTSHQIQRSHENHRRFLHRVRSSKIKIHRVTTIMVNPSIHDAIFLPKGEGNTHPKSDCPMKEVLTDALPTVISTMFMPYGNTHPKSDCLMKEVPIDALPTDVNTMFMSYGNTHPKSDCPMKEVLTDALPTVISTMFMSYGMHPYPEKTTTVPSHLNDHVIHVATINDDQSTRDHTRTSPSTTTRPSTVCPARLPYSRLQRLPYSRRRPRRPIEPNDDAMMLPRSYQDRSPISNCAPSPHPLPYVFSKIGRAQS